MATMRNAMPNPTFQLTEHLLTFAATHRRPAQACSSAGPGLELPWPHFDVSFLPVNRGELQRGAVFWPVAKNCGSRRWASAKPVAAWPLLRQTPSRWAYAPVRQHARPLLWLKSIEPSSFAGWACWWNIIAWWRQYSPPCAASPAATPGNTGPQSTYRRQTPERASGR